MRRTYARSVFVSIVVATVAPGLLACGDSPSCSDPTVCGGNGAVETDASSIDGGLVGVPAPDGSVSDSASPADAADAAEQEITTSNEAPGSRLKPIYERYDFDDGAESLTFYGLFHDAKRDEPCSTQRLSDGALHCAPSGQPIAFPPDSYFADATCATTPVIGIYHDGRPGQCTSAYPTTTKRYLALPSVGNCGPSRLVEFPPTAPLAVNTIYRKNGASCTAVSVASTSTVTYEIYASPPLPLVELSPSVFASITQSVTLPATSSRLRMSLVASAGEDGSHWTSRGALVDSQRNEYCSARSASDQKMRCLPASGSVYQEGFSDSGCTKPAFSVSNNGACTNDPWYTFDSYMEQTDYTPGACFPVTKYARFAGSGLTTTYYGSPTTCSAQNVSLETGYTYYAASALPAPIPAASFTDIALSTPDVPNFRYVRNGSRIHFKSWGYTSSDGFNDVFDGAHPFDEQRKEECRPTTLSDGNVYCVPDSYEYFTYEDYFDDASCSEPVFGINKPSSACGPAPEMYAQSQFAVGACSAYRFFHVPSTPLASPKLYQRNLLGACVAYTGDVSNSEFFRRSDCTEILQSTFARMKLSVQQGP